MAELNGALTAPPSPQIGLGSARRPRSVNRRQTPRGKKIERAVAEQRQARSARDGGVTAPSVDPGYNHTPQRPRPSIAEATNTDLGAQLSRRVSSGAIDNSQAQQVASDRAILERAFGPKWREHVFGNARGARGLGWGTKAPRKQMINSLRNAALERAKAKLAE